MKPTRPFHQTPVITIDGPTASGKGTVAALVAATLGFHLLDSGALYRLTALASVRYNVEPDDGDALAKLVEQLHITFREGCAQLDGVDVSADIRAEEVGNRASAIAVHAQVRTALIARQRAFRKVPGLVADGRDMGTVIFPDATLKVFLTASVEARAARRHKQLIQKGFLLTWKTCYVICVSVTRGIQTVQPRHSSLRRTRRRWIPPGYPSTRRWARSSAGTTPFT